MMAIYDSDYTVPPLGPLHIWPSHNAKCIHFKTSEISAVLTISALFERPKSKTHLRLKAVSCDLLSNGGGSTCLQYAMTHSKQTFLFQRGKGTSENTWLKQDQNLTEKMLNCCPMSSTEGS